MATTGGLFLAKPGQSLAFRHVVFPASSGRAKLEIGKPAELDAKKVATDKRQERRQRQDQQQSSDR